MEYMEPIVRLPDGTMQCMQCDNAHKDDGLVAEGDQWVELLAAVEILMRRSFDTEGFVCVSRTMVVEEVAAVRAAIAKIHKVYREAAQDSIPPRF